jgi:hypothetical protein
MHGNTISLLLCMIVLTCVAKSFSNITNLWFSVHHELPRHGRAADPPRPPQRRPARRRRRAAAPLPYAAVQARRRRAAPWLRHCSAFPQPQELGRPLPTTPSPLVDKLAREWLSESDARAHVNPPRSHHEHRPTTSPVQHGQRVAGLARTRSEFVAYHRTENMKSGHRVPLGLHGH